MHGTRDWNVGRSKGELLEHVREDPFGLIVHRKSQLSSKDLGLHCDESNRTVGIRIHRFRYNVPNRHFKPKLFT